MQTTFLIIGLVTTALQVQSTAIPGKKASFLSILENTVKSTLEKKLLTELEKSVDWKNSPKFYEEALQLIKENEGQILGGIMRMVIDKSNGTGKLSIKTVEEVVSDFLNSRTHHKRDEDDHMMPNYLNIKFGGFGK